MSNLSVTIRNFHVAEHHATRSQVGKFPDVMEGLARGHLAKGNTEANITSALVTAEWMTGNMPGWGRAPAFHSMVATLHLPPGGSAVCARRTLYTFGEIAAICSLWFLPTELPCVRSARSPSFVSVETRGVQRCKSRES